MPILVVGIAFSFLIAGGVVWIHEGMRWSATGYWRPIAVNDFYAHLFGGNLGSSGGGISDALAWFAGADLGLVLFVIGIVVYVWVRRFSKAALN